MKKQDLMIGDWVKCKDPKCEGHQVDLIDLGNEEVGLDGEIYHFEDICHVPLTSSILYRNGFKIDGYAFLEIDKETHLEYYFPEHRLRKVWRGIDEWDNHAEKTEITFQCQCFYVHELQHALKMCGIEKEIVL